jgi:ABC-type transporter Mla MlaB component
MLRIYRTAAQPFGILLCLEGKLAGPWVQELAAAGSEASAPRALHLDLAAVTFVDAAGLQVLRDWLRGGAVFTSCSGLIAQLLHRELADDRDDNGEQNDSRRATLG